MVNCKAVKRQGWLRRPQIRRLKREGCMALARIKPGHMVRPASQVSEQPRPAATSHGYLLWYKTRCPIHSGKGKKKTVTASLCLLNP